MHDWKWLYPGMGVKRWFGVMAVGLGVIGLGLATLLNTQILTAIEQTTLQLVGDFVGAIPKRVVGVGLLVIGFLMLAWGMRSAIRSIVASISHLEDFSIADLVYRNRSLQRGPKIVVIGGGTGLATMLRGLKQYTNNVTAIVTVTDDGGSSGAIRQELGILPPGDIRNTLIALADTEPLMERLFQYRFSWGKGLEGHSFGNLFIAAMTDITGDFEAAIREFSKVLAVRGRVIPSTLDTVSLKAIYQDGSEVLGESQIPQQMKKIKQILLIPDVAHALPEAVQAINGADVVVLGPGSLYTSVIPNLLVKPITDTLVETKALKVYVCNVMTQPGETDGMSASDHVQAIIDHCGDQPVIDYALINNARITSMQAAKYREKQAYPIRADLARLARLGVKPIARPFLDELDLVRHDSHKLAQEIIGLALRQKGNNGKNLRMINPTDGE